jgi:hypothetical protein
MELAPSQERSRPLLKYISLQATEASEKMLVPLFNGNVVKNEGQGHRFYGCPWLSRENANSVSLPNSLFSVNPRDFFCFWKAENGFSGRFALQRLCLLLHFAETRDRIVQVIRNIRRLDTCVKIRWL